MPNGGVVLVVLAAVSGRVGDSTVIWKILQEISLEPKLGKAHSLA